MAKTVLITGASSGIGRATAELFQKKGWNVVATMRDPSKETVLNQLSNTVLAALDVTRVETIESTIQTAIQKFGAIDVVVNNAGFGVMGVFEATSEDNIKRQFDTNFFGLLSVIRTVLPHMRARRSGTIVNVSSVGGRMSMPLFSLYHASKFAVEGFTESLQYELAPLGIRVRLVEPGPVRTDFSGRSLSVTDVAGWEDYEAYQKRVVAKIEGQASAAGETAEYTARDVFKAATKKSKRLRYPSGKLAKALIYSSPFLPEAVARASMENSF